MPTEALDAEIELIAASLLPSERLARIDSEDAYPLYFIISSDDSEMCVHVQVDAEYPARDSAHIEVKGTGVGRNQAEKLSTWVKEKSALFVPDEEYPLFTLLTGDILPVLQTKDGKDADIDSGDIDTQPAAAVSAGQGDERVHHALLTSHHLLSATKRKDLLSLSSELSLIGFSKTGHPGILYAVGTKADLDAWIREVKSWNWLALKVRMTPEPFDADPASLKSKGKDSGARGGKGRGEWTELDKIADALEWLKAKGDGREKLLLDVGIGSGAG